MACGNVAFFERVHDRFSLPNSERRVIFPSLKLPIALPFRTADTRVDRQNDIRNIGQIAPFERFHHAGKILRGGRAHAHAFKFAVPLPSA